MSNQERAALDAALFRQNIDVDESIKENLLKHLHLVIEYNKILNLTRITNIEDAIVLHLEDSLSAYEEFTSHPGKFIDIGTGGGFPGIPLALVSQKEGTLLDSIKKKADAVSKIVQQLKLKNISVLGERSEEHAIQHREEYDVVIARAVSSLPVVEEYATPLLKTNGILVSLRSNEEDESIEQALRAAEILGLELVSERKFLLDNRFNRSIYVFEKTSESSVNLPRRNGMATKRPLGAK